MNPNQTSASSDDFSNPANIARKYNDMVERFNRKLKRSNNIASNYEKILSIATRNRKHIKAHAQVIANLNAKIEKLSIDIHSLGIDTCNEMVRRESKKKNIIIYNIPENENERDKTKVEALLNSLPECNINRFYCRRLGKFSENKVRPLLVKFFSDRDAKLVLQKKDSIRAPIKVKNDLT